MLFRISICLLLVSLCTGSFAQERGNIVLPYKKSQSNPLRGDSGSRKAALVVGISDYSSKNLTLKYANKDAALIFDYLLTARKFPKENVFMLPDSMATSGRIYNAIHDLMKWLVPGDELVLYFAGHGDVQTVADFDEAFFLAWDASDSRNYYGTAGTLKLTDLDNYTTRLSNVKKVKVSLIMDACHSGFDMRKDGVLKAQENISIGFNSINKMLGCAVNEFSYEADSIGHGLFSWYLVQGLMGLADAPADNIVTFDELKNWTQKKVASASKGKQNPVISARDGTTVFAEVNPETRAAALAMINKKSYGGLMAGRGMGDEDTLISGQLQPYIDRYNAFLFSKQLYHDDSSCLGVIYSLSNLKSTAARELKEGLQNHLAEQLETRSQMVLNEYLKGKSEQPEASVYYTASVDAGLADSLLPAGDPRKKNDRVMANFHEAFSYLRYDDFQKFGLAEKLLREALSLEDRAAYLYVTMSYLMQYQNKYDSAIYYARKAEEIIPSWTVPKNILGNLYHDLSQWDKSIEYHRSVLQMDSSFAWSYNNIGGALLDMDRIAEAESYYLQSLRIKQNSGKERMDRDWATTYGNLGVIYQERGLTAKAEKYFSMADSIDNSYSFAKQKLSDLYASIDGEKAEVLLKKAIDISPYDAHNYYSLAELYRENPLSKQALQTAQALYLQAIKLNPFDEWYYAGLGHLAFDNKQQDSALYWFNKAVEISRGSADALYSLAFYYALAGKPGSALPLYKKSLAINPYDIGITSDYTDLLLEQKDTATALNQMLLLTSLQLQSPKAFYVLGNFYHKTGRLTQAMQAYEKSLVVDPAYTDAIKALAFTSLQLGLPSKSRSYMQQLKKIDASPALSITFNNAVAEQSLRVPIQKRAAWLAGFIQRSPNNETLNELMAEATYLSGQDLRAAFTQLQKAENNLDYNSAALIKWLFVSALELGDTQRSKKLASRYINEVLNTEPAVYAIALKVAGNMQAAQKIKKQVQVQDIKNYRQNFKKIFASI